MEITATPWRQIGRTEEWIGYRYPEKKKKNLYRFLQMKHTTAIRLEQILDLHRKYTPCYYQKFQSANITDVHEVKMYTK